MAPPSKARIVAVQMLYQIDLNPEADLSTIRHLMVEELLRDPEQRERPESPETGVPQENVGSRFSADQDTEGDRREGDVETNWGETNRGESNRPRSRSEEPTDEESLRELTWRLFVGVREQRPMLDAKIQSVAENWSLKRMAPTDRNILRLGLYELIHTDADYIFILNEAIELARAFGSAQSFQFVNGILDKLVPDEKRPRPAKAGRLSAAPGFTPRNPEAGDPR